MRKCFVGRMGEVDAGRGFLNSKRKAIFLGENGKGNSNYGERRRISV